MKYFVEKKEKKKKKKKEKEKEEQVFSQQISATCLWYPKCGIKSNITSI